MEHRRHHLQEGGNLLAAGLEERFRSSRHTSLDVRLIVALASAGTATLGLAGGLTASELTLGFGAHGWLLALPLALGLFAHWAADGVGGSALRVALSRSAYRLTLGAGILLAHILGATNRANRLFAVNSALRASGLFTLHLAARAFADGVAHSRADGVIALPSAGRVALQQRRKSMINRPRTPHSTRQDTETLKPKPSHKLRNP